MNFESRIERLSGDEEICSGWGSTIILALHVMALKLREKLTGRSMLDHKIERGIYEGSN